MDLAAIVKTVREEGAHCIPDFINEAELAEVRDALACALAETGHAEEIPGERSRLSGIELLRYPGLARVFYSSRIKAICTAILEEPEPFLIEIIANRYIPPHAGMHAHLDAPVDEPVPAFSRVTWALFLDDISADSGALLYAPGTHLDNFEDTDTPPLTEQRIRDAAYVPIELSAGTLIVRSTDVWHAVAPIHHRRRYVTESYYSVSRQNPRMRADVAAERAKRCDVDRETIPVEMRPNFF